MPLDSFKTIWTITNGMASNETHVRGVACSLFSHLKDAEIIPKHVNPPAPWRWFAPHGPAFIQNNIVEPWPDIVLASGRQSIPYVLHIKRASGGKTFTAIMQDPRKNPNLFDFIWTPQHDKLRAPNVMTTLTSPLDFTAEDIAKAALVLEKRLTNLPAPYIGVLIGGKSHTYKFTKADMRQLTNELTKLTEYGYGLIITTSRRTSDALMDILKKALEKIERQTPYFLWDGTGENPYHGILGLSKALIVTSDSVNMIGEASLSGALVFVHHLTGGTKRFDRFHDEMRTQGLIQDFQADKLHQAVVSQKSQPAMNCTEEITRELLSRMEQFGR